MGRKEVEDLKAELTNLKSSYAFLNERVNANTTLKMYKDGNICGSIPVSDVLLSLLEYLGLECVRQTVATIKKLERKQEDR